MCLSAVVIKARSAVQFKEAIKTKDLYPNLEYLQSTSVQKRRDHLAFVGTILPIEHSFWNDHLPPLDWNCKCRIRPTDKEPTAVPPSAPKDKPKAGLGSNPAKSGSVFDLRKHPYTQNAGLPTCPECRRQGLFSRSLLSDDEEQLCPMHKMAKEKIDEIKRKRARLKEKDMKEWAKKHIPVEGSLYHLKGKRRNIRVMRRSVRSIAEHFTELHLKEIAREVAKLCERGRFLEEVELDPYSHNYEKKYNRGVSGYVYYKVEYKGLALRLNMEIINNEEIPYMVNIIKEESPN